MPNGRVRKAGAGTSRSAVYSFANGPGYNNIYNGTAWSVTNNMNRGSSSYTMGLGTSTLAKCVGGSGETTTVEDWNGSNWTSSPTLPTGSQQAGATGTQTAAIVFGGYLPSGSSQTTSQKYNGSWTTTPSLNVSRHNLGAAGGSDTSALAISGQNPSPTGYGMGEVELWNGSSWTATNALPSGPQSPNGGATGIVANGTVTSALAYGGTAQSLGVTTLTQSYNGSSWTTMANMINKREQGSSAGNINSNTSAITFGGQNQDVSGLIFTESFAAPGIKTQIINTF